MSSLPAHQVLARKWRPRDFDSLVGQDVVVRALRHALDNNRLHHAYLLTGTRGVGKTTIARIIAKALNCEQGVSSRPCGQCAACTGVDQGRFPDYVEMDAASNRRVEEMTVVLENAAYAPSLGRFKVFVIDEVHMLSAHAFNAMLKTLEEPPPHVVFVLATTDPQKVPVTVLSRCMQFGLRNMSAAAVAGHLETVLQAEGIAFEAPALAAIGRAAAGSMRDALSLLDQAIALGAGRVEEQPVRDMLGAVDDQVVVQLLERLVAGDGAGLVALSDEMGSENAPFGQVLQSLARELQQIALAQVVPALDHPLAAQILPEDVQVFYQAAIHGARDLSLAPDPQTGFLMTLLRMLAFRAAADGPAGARPAGPAPAAGQGAARHPAPSASAMPSASAAPVAAPSGERPGIGRSMLERLPPAIARAAGYTPGSGAGTRPTNAPASGRPPSLRKPPDSASSAAPAPVMAPAAPERPAAPATSAVPEMSATATPAVATPATAASAADAPENRSGSTIAFDGNWPGLVDRLPAGGATLEMLRQSELVSFSGNRFALRVPIRPYAEPALVARAADVLGQWFGQPVQLDVSLGDTSGRDTAAARAHEARRQREADAIESIEADPFVRELIDDFGATIVPDSIKPHEGKPR